MGMAVVLLGLLGAAYVLFDGSTDDADAQATVVLDALDKSIERPLVVYVDGQAPDGFDDYLRGLDAKEGALATDASPSSLIDLDAYVMLRSDWDVFRAIEGHDLQDLIRERTRDNGPDQGVTWALAELVSVEGVEKEVLLILATEAGMDSLGAFCFAVAIYDMARYAHNGAAFLNAEQGPGSYWKSCKSRGWSSPADLPHMN